MRDYIIRRMETVEMPDRHKQHLVNAGLSYTSESEFEQVLNH